jgi:predicted  nucleic acid-binding Zn-ribbon protein
MDIQLDELLRLQQADSRLAELLEQVAALPKQIAALEQKLQRQKQAVSEAEQAVVAEETKRRRLESDLRDQQQKILKYREQSNSVKTNEQFHALQHELSFVEAEIRRIEDVELASMIRSEDLEAQRNHARQELASQNKQIEAEKEAARSASVQKEQEIGTLKKQREVLRTTIDAALLTEYDRLTSSSRKTALARATGQRCTACQMALRPQFWNQVRTGKLIPCESCGRLLYYDSLLEPSSEPAPWEHP